MAKKSTPEKIQLTLHLKQSVARRLKLVADGQNRDAAEIVEELLERCMPQLEATLTKKKGHIPYA